MSIQDMEDLKQQYLNEMKSLSNQIQIKDYRNEKIDIRYRKECEVMIDELKGKLNGMSIEINKKKELQQLKQAANLSTYSPEPSRRLNSFCYNDDDDYDYEESTIPLNEIISQIPSRHMWGLITILVRLGSRKFTKGVAGIITQWDCKLIKARPGYNTSEIPNLESSFEGGGDMNKQPGTENIFARQSSNGSGGSGYQQNMLIFEGDDAHGFINSILRIKESRDRNFFGHPRYV
nr:hypothetical protein [Tanacetum cinerariifolium]